MQVIFNVRCPGRKRTLLKMFKGDTLCVCVWESVRIEHNFVFCVFNLIILLFYVDFKKKKHVEIGMWKYFLLV